MKNKTKVRRKKTFLKRNTDVFWHKIEENSENIKLSKRMKETTDLLSFHVVLIKPFRWFQKILSESLRLEHTLHLHQLDLLILLGHH